MSRIGRMPISVPDKVTVAVDDGIVRVKGPKGELSQSIPGGIRVEAQDGRSSATKRCTA
jgi:large subunit ribosomal protein L6